MPAIPHDAEHDDDVDALYLAGQLPSDAGEWLLVTELDGLPGAAFTVRHLPRDAWHAHGGDVLVRAWSLTPAVRAAGGPRRGVGGPGRSPDPGRAMGPPGTRG